jgi:drug/metabolite transporter (DMT)-like permease
MLADARLCHTRAFRIGGTRMSGQAGTSRIAGGGALFALAATLIWGVQFPVAKASFAWVDAYHGTLFRYAAPTFILLGALLWREGRGALRMDRRAARAALLGLVGMCCSPALVLGGLTFTRPEVVAVIVATQPATTALGGWLVYGRRPTRFTLACVSFAFVGAITVITRWNLTLAPSGMELVGVLMIFGGSLCWVAYTLASPTFVGWSTLRFTTVTVVSGAMGSCVLVAILAGAGVVEPPGARQWLAAMPHLLFLSLLGVLASMILWNLAIARIGALNAMLFANLIPVVTFAIGFAQGYRPLPAEIVGAGMVIAALVANNLHLRRTR